MVVTAWTPNGGVDEVNIIAWCEIVVILSWQRPNFSIVAWLVSINALNSIFVPYRPVGWDMVRSVLLDIDSLDKLSGVTHDLLVILSWIHPYYSPVLFVTHHCQQIRNCVIDRMNSINPRIVFQSETTEQIGVLRKRILFLSSQPVFWNPSEAIKYCHPCGC